MALPVMTIDGDVVAVQSHWTSDGSRIVTEATVRTPDGATVVVSQLGGSVDGIGMRQWPGPELLVVGMTVAVAAHRDVDLAQQPHIVLDSAKVIAYPPDFVRTGPTKSGKYLYWESGCVYITPDPAGTQALAYDVVLRIIDASIASWNNGAAACSYLKLIVEPPVAPPVVPPVALEVYGKDHVNLIKFRDTVWGRPAVRDAPAKAYPPEAAAITSATYIDDRTSSRDGAIVDADIEINGVGFAISVDGQSNTSGLTKSDLQNTLTHELGHLQGLEHTCRLSTNEPARIDNSGNPVPLCSAIPRPPATPAQQAIVDATMYPSQEADERTKSTLSDDDIAAICAVYPTANDPNNCTQVSSTGGGCCSASGLDDRPGVSFLLAGAVLLLMRRRKTSPNV
ncbi:MAG: hypothetical protein ABIY55_35110 [Kofleriaceae bacterium]